MSVSTLLYVKLFSKDKDKIVFSCAALPCTHTHTHKALGDKTQTSKKNTVST